MYSGIIQQMAKQRTAKKDGAVKKICATSLDTAPQPLSPCFCIFATMSTLWFPFKNLYLSLILYNHIF